MNAALELSAIFSRIGAHKASSAVLQANGDQISSLGGSVGCMCITQAAT